MKMLPTEDETVKKILKLYFLFLHPIKYFDGLSNGLQRTLNAGKPTKKFRTIVFEV